MIILNNELIKDKLISCYLIPSWKTIYFNNKKCSLYFYILLYYIKLYFNQIKNIFN